MRFLVYFLFVSCFCNGSILEEALTKFYTGYFSLFTDGTVTDKVKEHTMKKIETWHAILADKGRDTETIIKLMDYSLPYLINEIDKEKGEKEDSVIEYNKNHLNYLVRKFKSRI